MRQMTLDGCATDAQIVASLTLDEKIERAIALLRAHEPPEGYYLAFSGGKDSCVIKELAKMAGVKFEAWYNNTTIDPPELVRFIKRAHPDARWNQPRRELGNMLHAIAQGPHGVAPPTRFSRWCCKEYKETGGKGRVRVFGVRAAESRGRLERWSEVSEDLYGQPAICPIVYWADNQVWEFIRSTGIPYCELYDEGFDRLGCVGCPLINEGPRLRQFARWPRYGELWKRAVVANWERWKDVPNSKTGEPRFHAKFRTGEEFWRWWLADERPDVIRECQSGVLWTNEDAA